MKKLLLLCTLTLVFMSGCTQVVTAPIKIAGSVVGTTFDVAHAVVGSDDDDD
jgi:uncharacterized protein YceK